MVEYISITDINYVVSALDAIYTLTSQLDSIQTKSIISDHLKVTLKGADEYFHIVFTRLILIKCLIKKQGNYLIIFFKNFPEMEEKILMCLNITIVL